MFGNIKMKTNHCNKAKFVLLFWVYSCRTLWRQYESFVLRVKFNIILINFLLYNYHVIRTLTGNKHFYQIQLIQHRSLQDLKTFLSRTFEFADIIKCLIYHIFISSNKEVSLNLHRIIFVFLSTLPS